MSGFAGPASQAWVLDAAVVELLPGNGDDLRFAAARLRSTVEPLRRAITASDRLAAVLDGQLWWGDAWQRFVEQTDHASLSYLATNAIDAMEEAAAALDGLAAAHDRHQDRLRWCRRRLDEETAIAAAGGDPTGGFQIVDEARDIHRLHAESERYLRQVLDRLDDAPILATPPPSLGDQARDVVTGAWHQSWQFASGAISGTLDLAKLVAALSTPLAPIIIYHHLREHGDEYLAAARFALDDPLGFAVTVGKAAIDLEGLQENPARWLGELLPDVALSIATAGTGSAIRGVRAADRMFDAIDNMQHVTTAARVVKGMSSVETYSGAVITTGGKAQRRC